MTTTVPEPWQPFLMDSRRNTPDWQTVSRVWRCGCGSGHILDYEYHTMWRCRGCNHMHDLRPMPELNIKIRLDAALFTKGVDVMREALARVVR